MLYFFTDDDGFMTGYSNEKPKNRDFIEQENFIDSSFMKPKWDGSKWVEGISDEELAELEQGNQAEPSQEQLMINALGMQVAMLQSKLAGGENNV